MGVLVKLSRYMKNNSKAILVTKTFLPPIEKFHKYVSTIWKTNQLTNQGPLLKEFELKVKKYLGVKYFDFVTNGTIALQLAFKALDITEGEIITTPFSYVATTSAILWERCTPVYVDIDPKTLCIDADKIERSITKKTKAILAVHVFGYPCNIEKIKKIADKYKVKVIYDAAHAFGVVYKGKSLLSYGDISIGSFHATKVFHTIEGGCVVTNNKDLNKKIDLIKRFGHAGDDHFTLGINAKASEFQAAMGLCNLEYVEDIIRKRKSIVELYDKLLGNKFQIRKLPSELKYNYAYYPIIVENEKKTLEVIKKLNNHNIFPRRYFYPSLNLLPYLKNKQSCPISENISPRILCLPLFTDINKETVIKISRILTQI
jgi:dTDP-4-amino-4,6-dideoxygalactose transaminase